MRGALTRIHHRFVTMPARDPDEAGRRATPLELFFDLVFVVAVTQVSEGLHHAVVDGHAADGVLWYALAFAGIWWAWVNWTWFASAFDSDDLVFRLGAFVQMFGVLVLAAGISRAFEGDFAISVAGYVIMRLALVGQWLRVAVALPRMRPAALRFAVSITLVQLAWIARLAIDEPIGVAAFVVLFAVELTIPWWAERSRNTPWHAHHVSERYVLFSLIVLGESVLSATLAVKSAMDDEGPDDVLVQLAVSGFVVVCAMWWIYTLRPAHLFLRHRSLAFRWSYGHYAIFSSIAAVGSGIAVVVDQATHHAEEVTTAEAGASVAVPTAVFLVTVWFFHLRPHGTDRRTESACLLGAVLVLLTPLTPVPLESTAAVLIGVAIAVGHRGHRASRTS
ncbi:low temperature requirement protein A [Streptomyces macrosporus]|uniref:Low temperature requirement protein A n=1 Tax=Streptomyces macrosporus TaxID=44032 RepID=A0ABN3JSW6_9ACTN